MAFALSLALYAAPQMVFRVASDLWDRSTICPDHHSPHRNTRRATAAVSSLSQAEEENGQSRTYLGIHWSFDKTEGIAQGRRVADYVFANAFTSIPTKKLQ
ncbi:MAG TPA: hypothetical protein VGI41_02295 [Candidatus Udaeobacter sp.]